MLELRFFGRTTILLNHQPLTTLVSEKAIALLAYLALESGEHSRDKLATLLWGEMPDKRAKANLRMACYAIQQNIPDALLTTRRTVAFNAQLPHQVDVLQFEQTRDPKRAAALYQGDFLSELAVDNAGAFEAWQRIQRERLRLKTLQLLTDLQSQALAQGDWAQGEKTARRLLAIEPWQEQAHRVLMQCLARQGNFGAALTQYAACVTLLADELGVEPAPATQQLVARIRAARRKTSVRLPQNKTPFFGRKSTLQQIASRLLDPNCRLLTLHGSGGSGKTRLAIEAARQQAGWFLNEVYFVSLAELNAATQDVLAGTIAHAVGLTFQPKGSLLEQLKTFLHQHELLLLLDNAEHLADDVADFVSDLLAETTALKLLITSRERLRLQEEWVVAVSGLAFPTTQDAAANQWPSVTLFHQTARRTLATYDPHASVAAVNQICRRLEGLPLGIELAASLLGAQSPHGPSRSAETVAAAIEKTLDSLAADYRNLPPRQRSLRATFEYSWSLLTADEQQLLTQLAVFRGAFNQAAMTAITGARHLTTLQDKALVQVGADGWYQLHEMVREFSAEKQPDPSAIQLRHMRYFSDWLAALDSELTSSTSTQITHSMGNIRAAWQTAMRHHAVDILAHMIPPLAEYYQTSGLLQLGIEQFDTALQWANESAEWDGSRDQLALMRCRLELTLGRLYEQKYDLDQSTFHLENAAALAAQHQLHREAIQTRIFQAITQSHHSEMDAIAIFQQAATAALKHNLLRLLAFCNAHWANSLVNFGDYANAERVGREAIEIAQELQLQRLLQMGKYTLGRIYTSTNRLLEAEALLADALAIAVTRDDQVGQMTLYYELATTQNARGNAVAARDNFNASLQIAETLDLALNQAHARQGLGSLASKARNFTESRSHFTALLQLCQTLNDPLGEQIGRMALAKIDMEEGLYDSAEKQLRTAITMLHTLGTRPFLLQAIVTWAHLRHAQGFTAEAQHTLAVVQADPATTAATHRRINALPFAPAPSHSHDVETFLRVNHFYA